LRRLYGALERSWKEIYDDVPEQAFYMTGTIADVLRQAEAMEEVEESLNLEGADESAV
jgi:F0F1-type ATP synthase beta subunit